MKNKFSKLKVIFAWLITLAMILPVSVPAAASSEEDLAQIDRIYTEIDGLKSTVDGLRSTLDQLTSQPSDPNVYEPLVKLLSPQTISAEPGQTLDVVITLKNIGTSVAENVLTQALPANLISVVFLDNSNNINTIAENATRSMTMSVKIDSKIEPGTYDIALNHSYRTKDKQNKSSTDTLKVYVSGGAVSEPNVTLGGFRSNVNTIVPGGQITITGNIKNIGDGAASHVQTSLAELDTANLFLTSDLNSNYYSSMEPGYEGTVNFTFRASDNAKNGTYPVNFKLTYRDENNETQEENYTYFINISSEEEFVPRASLQIMDLTAPSGVFEVGQNATVALRLTNSGAGAAERIKITATPVDTAAVVPTSSNIQTINSLASNAEQVLNFSFSPTEASKTQSYVIGFKIEYYTGAKNSDGSDEMLSFDQYASINVNNPEEEDPEGEDGKISKPKMIVSSYSVDPQVVNAGREFTLNITFQNTSSVNAVENIKIMLEATDATEAKGSVFNPVGGSNTIYIDRVDVKEEVTYNLKFYTVSDAEQRSYKMKVDFQYQDEELNDYTETEQLAINVKQITRLELNEIEFPQSAMVGEDVYFSAGMTNSGRTTIYNLRVRVDLEEGSELDSRQATDYLANVGRGNSVNFDGILVMNTPGIQRGAFVAYGEDDMGEPVEVSRPFAIEVTEGGDMFDPGMMDPGFMDPGMMDPGMVEEEQGGFMGFISNPWVWGSGIGVLVIVIIVVIVVVRRRKKRVDFDE